MTSSWLDIPSDSDFSLANIPFGVFSVEPAKSRPRCCTAVGACVVDLSTLAEAGLFENIPDFSPSVFSKSTLNSFLCCPRKTWVGVRNRLVSLFSEEGSRDLRDNADLRAASFHDISFVILHLPAKIGDYTDFYASREHATNVGTILRGKDNALQPNWLHLPVGYHGRASTVFVSGTPVRRPCGQLQKDRDDPKQGSVHGPCKLLDFELEMAFYVGGPSNKPGQPLTVEEARERIFGFSLMNDWSARDIQKWEYVPLGPFTSKNFATSVSPWIVTTMALEEFVVPTSAKEQVDPAPLEYLRDPKYSSFDVALEVAIQSPNADKPETVCRSNFANLYWNAAQQLAHHSVTGCVMQAGDLLGSGTISGSDPKSFGSMLELSWKGTREVPLGDSGEMRKFLQDGDRVIMKGWCEKEGHGRVGFGECSGNILAANDHTPISRSISMPKAEDRYQNLKLFSFWRSSASWRVRAALVAKKIPYEYVPVDLMQGKNYDPSHTKINPMAQVPMLECTDTMFNQKIRISQSVAIIEFLEEVFTDRQPLYPSDPGDRAAAREMVEIINAGTQPLQNLKMLEQLGSMSGGNLDTMAFAAARITKGLKALETLVAQRHKHAPCKKYCLGGFAPTVVDLFLAPQLSNCGRFGVDAKEVCPTLTRIGNVCLEHPWLKLSHALIQPDAPEEERPQG